MRIRQATGNRGHAGGLAIAAALLVPATLCLFAGPAAADSGTAAAKPSALNVHRDVGPGTGYGPRASRVVRELQRLLARTGYPAGSIDGRYGPLTESAVMRFQANGGLQVDGIAGPHTFAALTTATVALRRGEGYVPGGSATIRNLQLLLAGAGYSPGAIDGRFGPHTEHAVRLYQAHQHLPINGIVDSQTLTDLRSQAKPSGINGGGQKGTSPNTASGRTRTRNTPTRATAPSATTHTTPAAPAPPSKAQQKPSAAKPSSTAPAPAAPAPSSATPPPAAPAASPGQGPSSGPNPLAWIVPLVLLVLILPLGVAVYLRRRRSRTQTGVIPVPKPIAALPVSASNETEPDEPVVAVPPHAETRNDDGKAPVHGSNGKAPVRNGNGRASVHNGNGKAPDISAELLDTSSAFERGLLLEAGKDLAGAEAAYRLADQRGHAAAASNLGVLLEARGDRVGAEAAYRRADDRGDANGAFNLGVLLEASDDMDGAEAAYRRADERGHAAAASNLGVLLEARGDLIGAEAAYRRADERGEANGAFNLGVLLEEHEDFAGADAAYRRAEKTGDEQVAELAHTAVLELAPQVTTSVATGNGRSDHGP